MFTLTSKYRQKKHELQVLQARAQALEGELGKYKERHQALEQTYHGLSKLHGTATGALIESKQEVLALEMDLKAKEQIIALLTEENKNLQKKLKVAEEVKNQLSIEIQNKQKQLAATVVRQTQTDIMPSSAVKSAVLEKSNEQQPGQLPKQDDSNKIDKGRTEPLTSSSDSTKTRPRPMTERGETVAATNTDENANVIITGAAAAAATNPAKKQQVSKANQRHPSTRGMGPNGDGMEREMAMHRMAPVMNNMQRAREAMKSHDPVDAVLANLKQKTAQERNESTQDIVQELLKFCSALEDGGGRQDPMQKSKSSAGLLFSNQAAMAQTQKSKSSAALNPDAEPFIPSISG